MNKFVYLIKSLESDKYKIGVSKNPKKRLKQLQTGNGEELVLINEFNSRYPYKVEKAIQKIFNHNNIKGEWFELSLNDELLFITFCDKTEKNISFLIENENNFI